MMLLQASRPLTATPARATRRAAWYDSSWTAISSYCVPDRNVTGRLPAGRGPALRTPSSIDCGRVEVASNSRNRLHRPAAQGEHVLLNVAIAMPAPLRPKKGSIDASAIVRLSLGRYG